MESHAARWWDYNYGGAKSGTLGIGGPSFMNLLLPGSQEFFEVLSAPARASAGKCYFLHKPCSCCAAARAGRWCCLRNLYTDVDGAAAHAGRCHLLRTPCTRCAADRAGSIFYNGGLVPQIWQVGVIVRTGSRWN